MWDSGNKVSSDKMSYELDCTPPFLFQFVVIQADVISLPLHAKHDVSVLCLYMYIVCNFGLVLTLPLTVVSGNCILEMS